MHGSLTTPERTTLGLILPSAWERPQGLTSGSGLGRPAMQKPGEMITFQSGQRPRTAPDGQHRDGASSTTHGQPTNSTFDKTGTHGSRLTAHDDNQPATTTKIRTRTPGPLRLGGRATTAHKVAGQACKETPHACGLSTGHVHFPTSWRETTSRGTWRMIRKRTPHEIWTVTETTHQQRQLLLQTLSITTPFVACHRDQDPFLQSHSETPRISRLLVTYSN